jgi:hypothetical protein
VGVAVFVSVVQAVNERISTRNRARKNRLGISIYSSKGSATICRIVILP